MERILLLFKGDEFFTGLLKKNFCYLRKTEGQMGSRKLGARPGIMPGSKT